MEKSILIKGVTHENEICDVLLRNGLIEQIAKNIQVQADLVIDGAHKAILPAFYNGHTHSPMTFFRGYADDYELFTWLSKFIWPAENLMTPEDVFYASKLAMLEMIKNGCCFFNDMYWFQDMTLQAAEEMKIRACIGLIIFERSGCIDFIEKNRQLNERLIQSRHNNSSRIQLAYAPHAIYTISKETFIQIAKNAKKYNIPIHTHLAETQKEFDDCIDEHGMTPVAYLNTLGVFDVQTFAAHCVHLTDEDIEILRQKEVVIIHNPCSNMKLCSGVFAYQRITEAQCHIALGTDGCGSNNSLSMFDEMKFAALGAKHNFSNPILAPAHEIYKIATQKTAENFNIFGGVIEEGRVADCILVDLLAPELIGYDLISNMVYAANRSCVDTLICDGNILMQNRKIQGEEEILAQARKHCAKFFELRKGLNHEISFN